MDVKRVASYLIQYFNSTGDPISNLKLQKILYYIQVWYKVHFPGESLFDELPEAWVHGPVYPSVYNEYKSFNGSPITPTDGYLTDKQILAERKAVFQGSRGQEFITGIMEFYGSKTGFMLELMTHNEQPWIRARKGISPIKPSNEKIDLDFAEEYYRSLLTA